MLKREPEEARTILVGVGLLKVDLDRSAWFDLLELLAKVV
jgi:proteasome assembly chaperone 3